MSPSVQAEAPGPLFLADDLALDFINSAFGVGAAHHECLDSDAGVLDWLRRSGLPAASAEAAPPGRLLQAALALRQTIRALVEQRKAGAVGELTALNRVLAAGSARELVLEHGHLHYRRRAVAARAEDLLVPVAEAAARLLAEGDFALVRKCESHDCTLWFYDRTKSHRRRWCSMAQCGNRMKVAAFRARRHKTD
jgi:predicted RNA-binding Zn ribbon-like protein